jgi:hypothetical protein
MPSSKPADYETLVANFAAIVVGDTKVCSEDVVDTDAQVVGPVEELYVLATEIRAGANPYSHVEENERGTFSHHRQEGGPPVRNAPSLPQSASESVQLLRRRAAEAQRLVDQAEVALMEVQRQVEQNTLQEQYVDSLRHEDMEYSDPSVRTPSTYEGEEQPNYYSSTGSDNNESVESWERAQNLYDREERNRNREERASERAEERAAAQPTAESSENSSVVEETEVSQWRNPGSTPSPLPNPDYRQAVPTGAQPTGVEPAMVPQEELGQAGIGSPWRDLLKIAIGCSLPITI